MNLKPIKHYLHNFEKTITTHGGSIRDDDPYKVETHLRQWVNLWDYVMLAYPSIKKQHSQDYAQFRYEYIRLLAHPDTVVEYQKKAELQQICSKWLRFYYEPDKSPLSDIANELIPVMMINQKKLSEQPAIRISVINILAQEKTLFTRLIALLAKENQIEWLNILELQQLEQRLLQSPLNILQLQNIMMFLNR